jgi:hypothetical protein
MSVQIEHVQIEQKSHAMPPCDGFTITLWRGYTAKRIDRIFSSASNVQQQEASHDAEVFVKTIHAGDLIRTRHGPITMPSKSRSQRV